MFNLYGADRYCDEIAVLVGINDTSCGDYFAWCLCGALVQQIPQGYCVSQLRPAVIGLLLCHSSGGFIFVAHAALGFRGSRRLRMGNRTLHG